uniref:Uncharacterized protein n=1 Tax=Chromulina nebulosa TaxID=96789 RepID=A0A7S0SUY6_9STRA
MESRDRAVSKEEGKALANEYNAGFLEVSAKNNFKIREAFELLVRKVIAKKPNAGQHDGPGGVFGAGKIDNSGDDRQLRKSTSRKDPSSQTSPKSSNKTRASESTSPASPNKAQKKKGGCFIL